MTPDATVTVIGIFLVVGSVLWIWMTHDTTVMGLTPIQYAHFCEITRYARSNYTSLASVTYEHILISEPEYQPYALTGMSTYVLSRVDVDNPQAAYIMAHSLDKLYWGYTEALNKQIEQATPIIRAYMDDFVTTTNTGNYELKKVLLTHDFP